MPARIEVSPMRPVRCVPSALETPCVEWTAKLGAKGYGVRSDYLQRVTKAHRAAFHEAYGWWPKVVRHRCDNPPCVNAKHLVAGTQADNIRDMDVRGRRASGEANGNSVLTENEVREIRKMREGGLTYEGIRMAFGRSYGAVWKAANYHSWKGLK